MKHAGKISAATLRKLKAVAIKASKRAYCPYSHFPVGAAVLTSRGKIHTGCNVENASYGLTICAERNAIFQAIAAGEERVIAVVIYTPTPVPSAACGACRQVINEFGPDTLIWVYCKSVEVMETKLSALLPAAFGPANLSGDGRG